VTLRIVRTLIGACAVLLTSAARADDNPLSSDLDPRSGVHPSGSLLKGWSPVGPRWFVSARADVGFLFMRPRSSVGYGLPHDHWGGIDIVPILSSWQTGAYSGVRYRHPRFEVRTGMLFSHSFRRSLLTPRDSYDVRDLELLTGDQAQFWASDSEITWNLPIWHFVLQSETQAIVVTSDLGDRYVYVDTLGVVVAPPLALRHRTVFQYHVTPISGLYVGPAFETVWVPERPDPWVLRAGAVVSFAMYQDVSIRTDIIPTVRSPDNLGRSGAPWLAVNLRVRWATN
jgi:hypothetical protein